MSDTKIMNGAADSIPEIHINERKPIVTCELNDLNYVKIFNLSIANLFGGYVGERALGQMSKSFRDWGVHSIIKIMLIIILFNNNPNNNPKV